MLVVKPKAATPASKSRQLADAQRNDGHSQRAKAGTEAAFADTQQ